MQSACSKYDTRTSQNIYFDLSKTRHRTTSWSKKFTLNFCPKTTKTYHPPFPNLPQKPQLQVPSTPNVPRGIIGKQPDPGWRHPGGEEAQERAPRNPNESLCDGSNGEGETWEYTTSQILQHKAITQRLEKQPNTSN